MKFVHKYVLTGDGQSPQKNCLWLTPHSLTHLQKHSPFYVTALSSFSVTCKKKKKIVIVPRKLKLRSYLCINPVKAVEGKHARAKYLGHHHTWLWQNVSVWTPTAVPGFVVYSHRAHRGAHDEFEPAAHKGKGAGGSDLQQDIYKHCCSVAHSSRGIFSKPAATCTKGLFKQKNLPIFFKCSQEEGLED